MNNALLRFILNRTKEPSTWRGLILLATICGVSLDPTQKEAIIAFGVALVGLIGVFGPDKGHPPVEPEIEFVDPSVPVADTSNG